MSRAPEGALVRMRMRSRVGVLLDDLPAELRARAASYYRARPAEFWNELARMQVRMLKTRLYFRPSYYPDHSVGQLPLPPETKDDGSDLWQIELEPFPDSMVPIDGHTLIWRPYTFEAVLLSDKGSLECPANEERGARCVQPELAEIGGRYAEGASDGPLGPLHLPVDPQLLLQRTAFACITEAQFPRNSVDSENAWQFFDQTCEVETPTIPCDYTACPTEYVCESDTQAGTTVPGGWCVKKSACHHYGHWARGVRRADRSEEPPESCSDALRNRIGRITTELEFERLDWNADGTTAPCLRDQVRVGIHTQPARNGIPLDAPDLKVRTEALREHRVVYKYITKHGCEMQEHCVGRHGWRRLLEFDATGYNIGTRPLHIGEVDYFLEGNEADNVDHGVFEFHACHNHYHFEHFGDFAYGGQGKHKNGFCLESTYRFSNNELSPLTTPYSDCEYQGVEVGWGDEYEAGIACQWVDITDIPTDPHTPLPLSFDSNPRGFLCEGRFTADPKTGKSFPAPDSDIQWDPMDGREGRPRIVRSHCPKSLKNCRVGHTVVDRPRCDRIDGWRSNNDSAVPIAFPKTGGMVSSPCHMSGPESFAEAAPSPKRNCGFDLWSKRPSRRAGVYACSADRPLLFECSLAKGRQTAPQVVRFCDASHRLGAIPCTFARSLRNVVVDASGPQRIAVPCPPAPGPNDPEEPGGLYSIYTAPLLDADGHGDVSCDLVVP